MRPVNHTLSVLGVMAALVLIAPAAATAGTYEITGCDLARDGQTAGWSAPPSPSRMFAGALCPSGGNPSRGILARTLAADDTVRRGTAARAFFHAPPGTAIVGLKGSYAFWRNSGTWQVGLSNGAQLIAGCPPYNFPCQAVEPNADLSFPPSGVIYVEALCTADTCPVNSSSFGPTGVQASAQLAATAVRIQDDSRPDVRVTGGNFLSDDWISGTVTANVEATDHSGVPKVELTVGAAVKSAAGACAPEMYRCPDLVDAVSTRTTGVTDDGVQVASVRAFDRAGNVSQQSRQIRIDNTAPRQPLGLTVVGGEGFRRANRFVLNWSNPPQTGAAPVAAALYEACPVNTASGGANCVRGERVGSGIAEITDLELPSRGEWTVRVWLRDSAGNEELDLAAPPLHLGFDDDSPELALAEARPEDPARVNVLAKDATSSVAKGEVELRREGREDWQPLPTELSEAGFSAVVDDERLRDGAYEVRARAFDRAGNERSTTALGDGKIARLTLPLRLKTRLVAGQKRRPARGRKRNRLVARPQISFGRGMRVYGRLTSPGGNPLAGAPIEVSEQVALPRHDFAPIGRVITSKTGRFSFRAAKGPKRVLRFRFGGTRTIRPSTTQVDLRVRAASTMRVSRRSVVNGEDVVFRGRLLGRPFSPVSKLLQLQAYSRRGWITFATPRASPRTGAWSYRYRFAATRGRVRYRFRVRIPREASYPFDVGTSGRVSVKVQGL